MQLSAEPMRVLSATGWGIFGAGADTQRGPWWEYLVVVEAAGHQALGGRGSSLLVYLGCEDENPDLAPRGRLPSPAP